MRHIFPFRMSLWTRSRGWFEVYSARPWTMGTEFVSKCTYGVKNYVFGAQQRSSPQLLDSSAVPPPAARLVVVRAGGGPAI